MVTISKSNPWWVWCLIVACSGAAGWWAGARTQALADQAMSEGAREPKQRSNAFPWVSAEVTRTEASGAVETMAQGLLAESTPMKADQGSAHEPPCIASTALRPTPEADLSRVMRGTDEERYQALVMQQNEGGITEATLKTLYESDASPKVRLLAFDLAMQAHEGNAPALRNALQAARLMPDAALSQEAARRLDALAMFDKAQAAALQAQSLR